MSHLLLLGLACSALSRQSGRETALGAAARDGNLGAMRDLLDGGADPNVADAGGNRWPPMIHAVHKQQLEAARLLLEYGADPDSAAPGGHTALMMAAAGGAPAMVALLLESGADAHRVGPAGITALSEAVTGGMLTGIHPPMLYGGHADTVRALLARVPDDALPGSFAGREVQFWMRLHAGFQRMRNPAVVPTAAEPPSPTVPRSSR